MSIVRMKRLRLLAVQAQRDEILHELMLLGCVEVSEPDPEADRELLTRLNRQDSTELQRNRADLATLQNAVRLLDRYAPAKKKLMQPLPEVKVGELLDESGIRADIELASKLALLDEKIRRLTAEESRERAFIESFLPWQDLDMPLEFGGTEKVAAILGTAPASLEAAPLESAIAAVTERAQLLPVSADKLQRCFLLVCMREEKDEILAALRPFSFNLTAMGEHKGTAGQNIKQAKERLNRMAEDKKNLSVQIAAEAIRREKLKLHTDTIATKIARAEVAARLLCTESVFTFQGWIPAEDESRFTETLSKFDCAWDTQEPDPEKPEEVPVKLKSNAVTRPFSMVTEMYSLPAYNGIDPNPLLFPSFSLFFGIMFADIGYGLLLALGGLLIKYKLKVKGTMGYLGGIALICGISCSIFGAVTGTFFGDIIPQIALFYGRSAALPALLDPLKEPMTVLIICLGIGVVHMLVGVTANAYMLVREGKWSDAICDAGAVYITFAGVALGALGITWWVAIAGVAWIVLTQGRSSKSIVGKLGGGLWALYNFVTGWFGDILSYSRIMALMLAGSVIAQVFNTLGAMTGNIFIFLIIFLAGHSLNLGLNIIGTYVHSSRLEYLEFFSKFYREGGRAFQPLEIKTNYYNICNN